MVPSPAEIRPLTSLRFLAASLVFWEHIVMLPGFGWLVGYTHSFGRIGVCVFFVLSGFILSYSYGEQDWRGAFAKNAGQFYWSRFARIYPLHWLMFLVALPLGLNSRTARVSVSEFPYLLTLTDSLWPGHPLVPQPVKAAWTLSCEVFFYLLAPLCFLALCRRKNPLALAGAMLASYTVLIVFLALKFGDLNWAAYVRMPEFLLGIAGYHFSRRVDLARLANKLFFAGIALLACVSIRDVVFGLPQLFYSFAYAPGALLVILAFASMRGAAKDLFSHPSLVLSGNASFALYLMHDPALRYLKVLLERNHIVLPRMWSFFVAVPLFAVLLVAATMCYKFYENPIRLKLRTLLQRRPSSVAPTVPREIPLGYQ
jgi:peptidoglycan/LPS O-acetylase OafA/YrhL